MKNFIWHILTAIVAIAVSLSACYYFYHRASGKNGYIITQEVFAGYKGAQELMARVKATEEVQRKVLDSLAAVAGVLEKSKNIRQLEVVKGEYQKLYRQYSEQNSAMLEKYDEQAWLQINQYVQEYGKSKNYGMIIGANGSGSLMYADSSLNVTKEVVEYLNRRYEGKK